MHLVKRLSPIFLLRKREENDGRIKFVGPGFDELLEGLRGEHAIVSRAVIQGPRRSESVTSPIVVHLRRRSVVTVNGEELYYGNKRQ